MMPLEQHQDIFYVSANEPEELKESSLKEESEAEDTSDHYTEEDEPSNLPKLYSKRVILVFSIVFSTIFGAVLLMVNMKATNNPKGRMHALIFGILYAFVSMAIANAMQVGSLLPLVINLIGATILNEYYWNTFIGMDTAYEKKSWKKPALISVLITLPFLLALFLL